MPGSYVLCPVVAQIIFTPQPLSQGIVFTHGVWMGGRAVGISLPGLYLKPYGVGS